MTRRDAVMRMLNSYEAWEKRLQEKCRWAHLNCESEYMQFPECHRPSGWTCPDKTCPISCMRVVDGVLIC
jgi:hypothetical protein